MTSTAHASHGQADPVAPAERWTIVEAPHPETPGGHGSWGYEGRCAVERVVEQRLWGWTDLSFRPTDVHEKWSHQQYVRRVLLLALPAGADPASSDRAPGDVLGFAGVELPLAGNTHLVEAGVVVHPDLAPQDRRDLAEALLVRVEQIADAAGRRTVLAYSEHAPEPPVGPGAIQAPTGSGRVPVDDLEARIALDHGYALEQVERYSALQMRPDGSDRGAHRALAHVAAARAGDGYVVRTWHDDVPRESLAGLAHLQTRMSTDAPAGGLEITEDPWDEARFADRLAGWRRRGFGFLISAAEHVATGTLAAFTVLTYPLDEPEFAFQEDTLVLVEHRGRNLGMLVKTANLDALAEHRPGTRRIHTWNAQENGPMLDINVALGFAPVGVVALWQKHLDG
ncbi:hypothetical protein GCM10025865_17070 [Paraoerskovia sediminicola]|uniref:N-acetyltransferase domain-containing protein n=1 Tax=Paraoerskovia sediminicola TaxID=1138587 RepID=A0ABM8G2Z9_9CELL|nr:GNAT family N-acetyltransferase [Paraoerskovia sediminicola]BDZ42408.1 hypothetical protein GCM10025865_17070 [Paraoerskovia sediminicola]